MDKFETIQGKLFYIVYCMHKQNEITQYQKGRIKDMIVQWNSQIQELIKDPNRLKQNLLELACSYSEKNNKIFYIQIMKTPNKQKQPLEVLVDQIQELVIVTSNQQVNLTVRYHHLWIQENNYYSDIFNCQNYYMKKT